MKRFLPLLLCSSTLFAAQSAPVTNTRLMDLTETNTLSVDNLSRAAVKIQGGTDNTTIGNTGDRLKIEGIIVATNVIDASTSSTTPLAASATFTGSTVEALTYASVSVSVYSSSGGTVQFQFSKDGVNFDRTKSYNVDPFMGTNVTADLATRYYRVRFINSATAQTAFRLQSILHPFYQTSTEEKENFEPETVRGRTYVTGALAGQSGTSVVYTVSANKVLHVTGGVITLYNSSLLSLGAGRLEIRDGSTTLRFPITVAGGGGPMAVPFNLPTGLRFTSNVTGNVVAGSITWSLFFTGYEADE